MTFARPPDRGFEIDGQPRGEAQRQPARQVLLQASRRASRRAGVGAARAERLEQADAAAGACRGAPPAGRGGLVAEADFRVDGQARRVHIARAHIPDGTRGRDRRAAGAYPARHEIPAAQETAAQDGCHEHPRTRQHTPTPGRGRRAAFRRLGDGPDCRQGAEKRAADAHREEHELHTHALRPGQCRSRGTP